MVFDGPRQTTPHLFVYPFLIHSHESWLEPPPANQQAASHLCHQTVLKEGFGFCDRCLEGRWNARSALSQETTRLPYNGNQHSLSSGAVTSNSAKGKRSSASFVSAALVWSGCSEVYLHVEKEAAGGLCHVPVFTIHPFWNRLIFFLVLSILRRKAAFWNPTPPCTITCTYMDLKTRRRWVKRRLTLVNHAFLLCHG